MNRDSQNRRVNRETIKMINDNEKLKLSKYIDYIEHLSKGHNRDQIYIDENSEIVALQCLAKGAIGTVVNIRCPSRYKIIIVGKNQLSKDAKITSANALVVRFADENGVEISPDTRIRIIKQKTSEALEIIATMLYKDITITEYLKTYPNGTKSHDKFYRFDNMVELNHEEHLKIEAINPDIGIDYKNIKLGFDIDLWEEYFY